MGNVEIMPRVERRRKWTDAEKAALLAEVEAEGGKVKLVARRHRISESVLYNWRSAWKMAAASVRSPQPVEFVPIGVFGRAHDAAPGTCRRTGASPPDRAASEDRVGRIEITLPNGARVRVDAFVNEKALSRVLRAHEGLGVISLAPGTKVFLACRPIDLRNGFDGLAAKAQQIIGADPFSGHLFLFRGKRGDYLKALYWDGTGLCLFAKRLEKGKFVWPPIVDGAMTLTPAQLALLIEAMDWRRTIAPPAPAQPMLV